MTTKRKISPQDTWQQESLIGPYLSRLDLTVVLDGRTGLAHLASLIRHGETEEWAACDVLPGVPISMITSAATELLHKLLRSEMERLSPF